MNDPLLRPGKYHLRPTPQNLRFQQDVVAGMIRGSDEVAIQSISPVSMGNKKLEEEKDEDDVRNAILDSHGMVDFPRLTPKMYSPPRKRETSSP